MTTRERGRLKSIVLDEVSLVDAPANPHARVTLLKLDRDKETRMQVHKIASDRVMSFDSFDEAVAHLTKSAGGRTAAMRQARARYPDLVSKHNDDGDEMIAKAAEAAAPRPVAKAVAAFETVVDEICKRDGCPRSEAMRRARVQRPDAFEAYQEA